MGSHSKVQPQVDVFLCKCGPILEEALDLEALSQDLEGVPAVRHVKIHHALCSPQGQTWMSDELRAAGSARVAVAACSPREHAQTFRRACEQAGLNPYLLAIANVREQCAWVSPSRDIATAKAAALARAAVSRAQRQQPLELRSIDANTDAVVVGAGVAGLTAALTMANAGRKVTLVEKDPVIGGRATRLSDLYPTLECASCSLEALLDEVIHHERIELLAYSEVEQVLGTFGNYLVRIRKKARSVDPLACLGMHCCHEVCPVEVPNEWEEGLSTRKAIFIPYMGALPNVSTVDRDVCLHFTGGDCDACASACPFEAIQLDATDELVEVAAGAIILATGAELDLSSDPPSAYALPRVFTTMELERMFNSSGCTDGEVKLRDGSRPQRIALLHCGDALGNAPAAACSSVCCMALAKHARLLRDKLPDAELTSFSWEQVYAGKGYRQFARSAIKEARVSQVRLGVDERIDVREGAECVRLVLTRDDGALELLDFDMVVVAPALKGAASSKPLLAALRLGADAQGFVLEAHERSCSYESRVKGVMLAGGVQGPKDIEQATSHGAAAAAAVLAALVPGKQLNIEPARAEVEAAKCGGCLTCPQLCPFSAITFDTERRVAMVNALLCQGCGVCVAACPSGAIVAHGFSDEQILAEIEALVS